MASKSGRAWELESFLDSLILELDKAQDTLSVKGVTRKLTYTVKDVAMDLHVFPSFEQGQLKFQTAKPGDEGASKISFQLGSITDRQIRETTHDPMKKDDVSIEMIDGVDDETKASLRKAGIHTSADIEKLEKRNVDVEKVVQKKAGKEKKVDYKNLANLINKARRRTVSPRMFGVETQPMPEGIALTLNGENLCLEMGGIADGYPKAVINNQQAEILSADSQQLRVMLKNENLKPGVNALQLALDPYALLQLEVSK